MRVAPEIEETPHDGAYRVELEPMFLTKLRKFIWRHSLRAEHDVTEGVGRVEPPLFGQQTPLRLEPVVDVRSRKRHEMVEGGEEELVAAHLADFMFSFYIVHNYYKRVHVDLIEE